MGIFGPPNIEKLQKKQDIKGLIKAANHMNSDIQKKAIETLTYIGKPAINILLQKLFDSWSQTECKKVSLILDRLNWVPENDKESVAFLMAKEKWFEVIQLGKAAALPLIDILNSWKRNREVRIVAAAILSIIGGNVALNALIKTYEKESMNIIRSVQEFFIHFTGGDIASRLGTTLKKKSLDNERRISASQVLAVIGKKGVETLLDVINTENGEAQVYSLYALASTGDSRAKELIRKFIHTLSKNDRSQLETILTIIEGSPEQLIAALNHSNLGIRGVAAMILGNMKIHSAAKELIKHIEDDNPVMFFAVSFALGKIGDPATLNTINNIFIQHTHWQVRIFGILILSEFTNNPEVIDLLTNLEKDTNLAIRALAKLSIEKIRNPSLLKR